MRIHAAPVFAPARLQEKFWQIMYVLVFVPWGKCCNSRAVLDLLKLVALGRISSECSNQHSISIRLVGGGEKGYLTGMLSSTCSFANSLQVVICNCHGGCNRSHDTGGKTLQYNDIVM